MKGKIHWLSEDLLSIKMKCDVALVLIKTKNYSLLPTVLEEIYQVAQEVTLSHCVKRGKDGKLQR